MKAVQEKMWVKPTCRLGLIGGNVRGSSSCAVFPMKQSSSQAPKCRLIGIDEGSGARNRGSLFLAPTEGHHFPVEYPSLLLETEDLQFEQSAAGLRACNCAFDDAIAGTLEISGGPLGPDNRPSRWSRNESTAALFRFSANLLDFFFSDSCIYS